MAEPPRTTVIVAGYSGDAVFAEAGEHIRITDVEGMQIGDMFAIARDDHHEFLCPSKTRAVIWKLFPELGEAFYSTRRRPILTYLEDHSPGAHDMFFSPCDLQLFTDLGVEGYHPNCNDNYLKAAAEIGIGHTFVPDPVNLFQNTPAAPDGTNAILMRDTPTQAGDSVTFRAELDIFLILTSCSVDQGFEGIAGTTSTPLKIEVFG